MIPEAGSVCLFTLTTRFDALDGVYRIRSIAMFTDLVGAGVDFVDNLYTPAGLTRDDFNADYASYTSDRVAVVEAVSDSSTVYYFPESVLGEVPDPTIKEYYPLILAVDLGIQQNSQVIQPLVSNISDQITAALGTNNPVRIVTDSTQRSYLTDSQYAEVVAARQALISKLVPLTVQLLNLEKQNAYLAAKVAAYESMIINNSPVESFPTASTTTTGGSS